MKAKFKYNDDNGDFIEFGVTVTSDRNPNAIFNVFGKIYDIWGYQRSKIQWELEPKDKESRYGYLSLCVNIHQILAILNYVKYYGEFKVNNIAKKHKTIEEILTELDTEYTL
jgi:hypothetical protein